MKTLEKLYVHLFLRRLRQRAYHIAHAAFNSSATIYPVQMTWEHKKTEKILVVTPHADDETFGMGGTIISHIEHGDSVKIIITSDNVTSIPDATLRTSEKRELRERECREAMGIFSVFDFEFLRFSDKNLASSAFLERLSFLLIENQPDVLYLPSIFDNHLDHRVVNLQIVRTLSKTEMPKPLIRGFEVWNPLPANHNNNISANIKKKITAIRCYKSQLKNVNYEHHIIGLNAYRAITLPGMTRYAEAFFELSCAEYSKFVHRHFSL